MIAETLEGVSDLNELNEISEFLQDEILDECLTNVVKLIAKPDIQPATAARLIVQLSAMSLKFRMIGKYYMIYDKDADQGSKKKNTYLSLSEGLDKLVDSLKYIARVS